MSNNPDATLDFRASITDVPYVEGDTIQFAFQFPTAKFNFASCSHKIDVRSGPNLTDTLKFTLSVGSGITAAIVDDQWVISITITAEQSASLALTDTYYSYQVTYPGGVVKKTYIKGMLLPDSNPTSDT